MSLMDKMFIFTFGLLLGFILTFAVMNEMESENMKSLHALVDEANQTSQDAINIANVYKDLCGK
jgi:hypothetical protein